MVGLSVGAALLAAVVATAPRGRRSRSLRTGHPPGPPASTGSPTWGRLGRGFAAAAVVALVAAATAAPVLPSAAAAVVALVTLRLRDSARQRREATEVRRRVVDACESVVGELRAGRPPGEALTDATRVWPALAPVTATSRLGGDVPRALRDLAEVPGASGLHLVAGAWQLCAASGTGLTHALEQVLLTVRAEEATARLVATELAASRATARMVTALPALLLLGAHGAGARPAHLLLGTLGGQVCLLAGVCLAGAGLLWIEHLARSAVEPR